MADTTAPTPSDASAPSSIDVGDNLRTAERFREVGKAHFQAGDYKAALVEFHQIYMYVHGFSPKGGSGDMMAGLGGKASSEAHVGVDDMRRVNELKLVHFSNVALCHLKLGNAPKCITYCTRALGLDPDNVKCLFRRGKCRLDTGDLDGAREDLQRVRQLDGANREIVPELQRLRQLSAAHDRKESKKFSKMFAKISTDADLTITDDAAAAQAATASAPASAPSPTEAPASAAM
ncbi:hypothetical protein KFE25_008414 [Diacronema lutheri]|uniref:Uncharacterized protein n=1 Tax=Diacronema lutheri TaxID=2081491 RepID=A0A8J6C197_DIALT|nr:hypothetical protein KFE25_008414 [Diacronema lutheri]